MVLYSCFFSGFFYRSSVPEALKTSVSSHHSGSSLNPKPWSVYLIRFSSWFSLWVGVSYVLGSLVLGFRTAGFRKFRVLGIECFDIVEGNSSVAFKALG